MKKNTKGIYLLEILLFISVIIFNIFKIRYSYNIILILSAIFCYLKFGFIKDNAFSKNNVIRIVIACLMGYLIVIYGLGVFTGFYKNNFSFDLKTIVGGIFLTILTIISQELIRYIVAKNCFKTKKPLIILTIIFIILNIVTQINISEFNDRWLIFVLISTFVLPIIAKEILCSYIAYKCSIVPNLIYCLAMELYFYVLPIIPNLGEYLYAVLRILLPAAIFFASAKVFKYHEKATGYSKKVSKRIILIPIILLSLVMVYLVSGLFKYKMIAIGSGSMEPVYYMGDAVIYEKLSVKDVKVGDILVFTQGHTIITHRIVNISKGPNSKYDIITKGDNNDKEDAYIVQADDVLGIVRYSVKYIGYPTLWLNKLIER